jgi:flagellar basal-body rod protein FlgC
MAFGRILSTTDIAASGLAAERMRMEVAANNIANAHSTRSAGGGPYRRQTAVFSTVLHDRASTRDVAEARHLGGVKIAGIETDQTPLPKIFDPGHPDADEDGFVMMPNVQVPHEMVDLLTASRAYEANLKSLQTHRRMAEQALSMLRGLS